MQCCLLQQALAIREASLGADHAEVAVARYNLGSTLYALNRSAEAVEQYRQVLPVFIERYGAGHPRVAMACNGLALSLLELDQVEAARQANLQALQIAEDNWPQGHEVRAEALALAAELNRRDEQLAAAETAARQALQMHAERVQTLDSRQAAIALILGAVLVDLGQLSEALALLQDAHHRLQSQLGDSDPRTRRASRLLAAIPPQNGDPPQ